MAVRSVFDQLGDKVTFTFPPRRIVSLVPSQTELLAELGLEKEVVGITRFCTHPSSWLKNKSIIGGTKNFKFNEIDAVKPDLIIGNKEENYAEGILRLREKYPVWMSDIISYEDSLLMIRLVGELTDRGECAAKVSDQIENSFKHLLKREAVSVLYLIWKKPWMAAGGHTFVNTMLEKIGLKNCLCDEPRYPQLSSEEIRSYAPGLIFLSSEPYPFREEHIEELRSISPSSRVMLVDGEMFSWYGSRLIKAPHYFNNLILT